MVVGGLCVVVPAVGRCGRSVVAVDVDVFQPIHLPGSVGLGHPRVLNDSNF